MTEEKDLELNIDDEPPQSNKPTELYSLRDGVIFIIDATEPMFQVDPDKEISYFSQCLEVINHQSLSSFCSYSNIQVLIP